MALLLVLAMAHMVASSVVVCALFTSHHSSEVVIDMFCLYFIILIA